MTAILVVRDDKGHLVMAGDRKLTMGWDFQQKSPVSKVIGRQGLLLSGSGNGYITDLIVSILQYPKMGNHIDVDTYMHTKFVPTVLVELATLKLMEPGTYRLNKDSDGSIDFADIAIAIKHRLFHLNLSSNGFTLDAIDAPFSLGSGGSYALGAYLAFCCSPLSLQEKIVSAMCIAAQVNPACDANIDIISEIDDEIPKHSKETKRQSKGNGEPGVSVTERKDSAPT